MPAIPNSHPEQVMVEERQKGGDAPGGQQTVTTSNGRLISLHCPTAVHESAHGECFGKGAPGGDLNKRTGKGGTQINIDRPCGNSLSVNRAFVQTLPACGWDLHC